MRSASASAFWGLLMSTSGSRIGTSPWPRICRPTSNCWSAMACTPLASASLTTERIFVPNTPLATARSRSASRPGIGFISWTPSASSSRPLSTLRNGTTPFTSHRYVRGVAALDLPVHRLLEEDGAEHPLAGEAGAGDDAGAHLVDPVEHLGFAVVGVLRRPRRA